MAFSDVQSVSCMQGYDANVVDAKHPCWMLARALFTSRIH